MGDGLRVALLYNLRHPALAHPDAPSDLFADLDKPDTVAAVQQALSDAGHEVIPLEADHTLLDTVRQVNPDICFNMARGRDGRDRSSHVPALLEMLQIPYTGSGVLSHALAMDKAAAKRIWEERNLPTAPFHVMHHPHEARPPALTAFPLFVKPLSENSCMGIDAGAVVWNEEQLYQRVAWVVQAYQQPALIERLLTGREFSVAILGNPNPVEPGHRRNSAAWPRYHGLPILQVMQRSQAEIASDSETRTAGHDGTTAPRYTCPADLGPMAATLQRLAVAAFEAIEAVDMARVDIRCDGDDRPHLLEIDTMPRLDPMSSRYVLMAAAGGIAFPALVNAILALAVQRHHLAYRVQGGANVTSWLNLCADGFTG